MKNVSMALLDWDTELWHYLIETLNCIHKNAASVDEDDIKTVGLPNTTRISDSVFEIFNIIWHVSRHGAALGLPKIPIVRKPSEDAIERGSQSCQHQSPENGETFSLNSTVASFKLTVNDCQLFIQIYDCRFSSRIVLGTQARKRLVLRTVLVSH